MSYYTDIQSIIYNDLNVQSLVSSYVLSSTTYYMIANGTIFPKSIKTDSNDNYEPTVKDKTINHYRSGNIDGGKPLVITNHIISCRAYEEIDAINIQDAVFNALNRVKSADCNTFFVCTKLRVIPPIDSTDNYNAQVEVSVKTST